MMVSRVVLLETAVTDKVCVSLVAPEPTPVKFTVINLVLALSRTSGIESRVGGSLTGATVKTKEVAALVVPSFTRRVIVAEPD